MHTSNVWRKAHLQLYFCVYMMWKETQQGTTLLCCAWRWWHTHLVWCCLISVGVYVCMYVWALLCCVWWWWHTCLVWCCWISVCMYVCMYVCMHACVSAAVLCMTMMAHSSGLMLFDICWCVCVCMYVCMYKRCCAVSDNDGTLILFDAVWYLLVCMYVYVCMC